MLIKTRGIVLRSVKYSETSLICDIFTEEKGRQSYLVSGVRKKNATIAAGLLQVMAILEMVAYHRDDQSLHRIKEVRHAYHYNVLPFEVKKASVGLFMTEILQKTIKEQEANPQLFEFLYQSFVALDLTPHSVANWHLVFMAQLSRYLGFLPQGDFSHQTPFFDLREGGFVAQEPLHHYHTARDVGQLFAQLLLLQYSNAHTLSLSRTDRNRLLNELIRFFQYHIDTLGSLRSLEVLREIW